MECISSEPVTWQIIILCTGEFTQPSTHLKAVMILMVHAVRVVAVASMNFSHLFFLSSEYGRCNLYRDGNRTSGVTTHKIDAAAELQHQPTQQPLFLSQSYDEWMEYRWIDGCGMEWREEEEGRKDR